MKDQRTINGRMTPWPKAVRAAINEASEAGYARAIVDVEGAILAGDVFEMINLTKQKLGHEPIEPLCLTIEQKVALSR